MRDCVGGRRRVAIGALTVAELRSGDSREYHTFPTAQLPGALIHQVVAGRAVTSSAETVARPPTRLLRQSVRTANRLYIYWACVQARRRCTRR